MKSQDEEYDLDPFLCGCAKCDNFWRRLCGSSSEADLLRHQTQVRAANTSTMYKETRGKERHPAVFRIGDRVLVKGRFRGVVKYVGATDENMLATKTYVGVKLDDQVGSVHNGINIKNGKRYFHCPRGHGALVKYTDVVCLKPPVARPKIYGNPMFPSYAQITRARKLRAQHDPCLDLGPPYNRKSSDDVASSRKHGYRHRSAPLLRQESSGSLEQATKPKSPGRHLLKEWKLQFGGDQRAETLARTLQKLYIAYEEGKQFVDEHGDNWDEQEDNEAEKNVQDGDKTRSLDNDDGGIMR